MAKSPLPSLFLFYGAEAHLIEKEVERIIDEHLQEKYRSFNLSYLQGESCTPEEIINLSNTNPFLTSKRIVVVTGFDKFSAEKSKKLLPYIKSPFHKTSLLLAGGNVKKTNLVFKALKVKGLVRPFYPMKQNQVVSWICKELKDDDWRIEVEAAKFVVDRVGCESRMLLPELEKLKLYTLKSRTIRLDDVRKLTSNIKTFTLFEFSEAIGKRNKETALITLYKIYSQGEVPLVILAMIIRQFRLILLTKTLLEKKTPDAEIVKKIGVPYFAFSPLKYQASLFSSKSIIKIFKSLYKIDMAMKSGDEPKKLLENFIFKIAR